MRPKASSDVANKKQKYILLGQKTYGAPRLPSWQGWGSLFPPQTPLSSFCSAAISVFLVHAPPTVFLSSNALGVDNMLAILGVQCILQFWHYFINSTSWWGIAKGQFKGIVDVYVYLYVWCWIYTVSKKVQIFKLFVTLSNLNWFSKFLHCWKAHEICCTM